MTDYGNNMTACLGLCWSHDQHLSLYSLVSAIIPQPVLNGEKQPGNLMKNTNLLLSAWLSRRNITFLQQIHCINSLDVHATPWKETLKQCMKYFNA